MKKKNNLRDDLTEALQSLTKKKGHEFAAAIEKECAEFWPNDYRGRLGYVRDYLSGKYTELNGAPGRPNTQRSRFQTYQLMLKTDAVAAQKFFRANKTAIISQERKSNADRK